MDGQRLLSNGVGEFQAAGVEEMTAQMNAVIFYGGYHRTAVENIAEQRMPGPGQVGTDLMSAAGFGNGFHQS